MFLPITKLKDITLKPFQYITLFSGYKDELIYTNESIYIPYMFMQQKENEHIHFYLNDDSKPVIIDIFYEINDYNVYLNWNFVKYRCKELEVSNMDEIFSDSIINTGLSGNILNIRDSFNYYDILMSTMKYYYDHLHESIILRLDNYDGNKFYIYNGK